MIALVLGGAAGVWKEAERASKLCRFSHVIACNDAAVAWPGRLDAFVTLHPDRLFGWLQDRKAAGRPAALKTVVHEGWKARMQSDDLKPDVVTEYLFEGQRDSGSSGLFCVKYALVNLRLPKAVVCGVPMQASHGHFFRARDWSGAHKHQKGWVQAMPHIAGRVKSMSGWTRELLGEPDREWAKG